LRGRGSYSAHQIRRTDLVDLMSADAVGAIATRSMLMSDYLTNNVKRLILFI
jgi:hypothetical protein